MYPTQSQHDKLPLLFWPYQQILDIFRPFFYLSTRGNAQPRPAVAVGGSLAVSPLCRDEVGFQKPCAMETLIILLCQIFWNLKAARSTNPKTQMLWLAIRRNPWLLLADFWAYSAGP